MEEIGNTLKLDSKIMLMQL